MTAYCSIRFIVCHSNTHSNKWTVRKEELHEGRLILIDMKTFVSKANAEAYKRQCEEAVGNET